MLIATINPTIFFITAQTFLVAQIFRNAMFSVTAADPVLRDVTDGGGVVDVVATHLRPLVQLAVF